MSTKSSLAFKEYPTKPRVLHVYKEMLDDEYYLDDGSNRILLPDATTAKKIAKAIEGK